MKMWTLALAVAAVLLVGLRPTAMPSAHAALRDSTAPVAARSLEFEREVGPKIDSAMHAVGDFFGRLIDGAVERWRAASLPQS